MRRDYREHLARFFLPTPELTREILLTNAALVAADDEEPDEEDVSKGEGEGHLPDDAPTEIETAVRTVEQGRFVIADQLYNYLAYLSHTPRAYRSLPFDLYEVVPSGMEALLGLEDTESQARPLLTRLTDEFRGDMLERHRGHYGEAPWGEVFLDLEGRFLLFRARGVEEAEPPDRHERAVLRVRPRRPR